MDQVKQTRAERSAANRAAWKRMRDRERREQEARMMERRRERREARAANRAAWWARIGHDVPGSEAEDLEQAHGDRLEDVSAKLHEGKPVNDVKRIGHDAFAGYPLEVDTWDVTSGIDRETYTVEASGYRVEVAPGEAVEVPTAKAARELIELAAETRRAEALKGGAFEPGRYRTGALTVDISAVTPGGVATYTVTVDGKTGDAHATRLRYEGGTPYLDLSAKRRDSYRLYPVDRAA